MEMERTIVGCVNAVNVVDKQTGSGVKANEDSCLV